MATLDHVKLVAKEDITVLRLGVEQGFKVFRGGKSVGNYLYGRSEASLFFVSYLETNW
jgi:hypothetical protein